MRRALVTGASCAIGPALATELAARGLEVVATARRRVIQTAPALPAGPGWR